MNKYLLGFIVLTLLASGVLLQLNDKVRIRVDDDRTTFYVPHEDYSWIWTVSGREYNRLFDGSSIMNRRSSGITVDTVFDNVTNEIEITRTTNYIRGPVIVDTYKFDGDFEELEKFPVFHTVEIYNASGFFYRYTVDDLSDTGSRTKLNSQTELSFGKNMKVELHPDYRWAWIGWPYGADSLSAQYDINSDYELFNVRLLDPPPADGFYLNRDGINTSITVLGLELGTSVNLIANHSTPSNICVDVENIAYGNKWVCGADNLNLTFSIDNYRKTKFDAGLDDYLINVSGNGTTFYVNDSTVLIPSHQYDLVDGLSINISGEDTTRNLTIYKINTTTDIDRYYHGFLLGERVFLNLTSEDVTSKNLTDTIGNVENIIYFNLDDNIGQTYTLSFNISGFPFGINFNDSFVNYTNIDKSNTSAQLAAQIILSNNATKTVFVYDDFADGSFSNQNWIKTADASAGGSPYSYSITNTETGGLFNMESDASGDGTAGSLELANNLIGNITPLNLQHSDDIYLELDYVEILQGQGNPPPSTTLNNYVSLGDRLIWSSSWTTCTKAPGAQCTSEANTPEDILINLTKQQNGTYRVQIAGSEKIFGTSIIGCGGYSHVYNWTTGTFTKTFDSCSGTVGTLDNDFYISPNYGSTKGIVLNQTLLCSSSGTSESRCLSATNDFNILNVNRSLWARQNGTVVSEVIYTAATNIQAATFDYDLFVWHKNSTYFMYALPFLSADNGTTWDGVTAGTKHSFSTPGSLLRWRVDLVMNESKAGDFLNDSLWIDKVNVTIDSGLPSNISIDWGDDGIIDYSNNFELNSTSGPIRINFAAINLTNAFTNATKLFEHTFLIPLGIRSETIGTIQVDEINLTYNPNPVMLNISAVEDFLNISTDFVNLTLSLGANDGNVNVSALAYDYAGGNQTIRLIVYPANFTLNQFNNSLSEENFTFTTNGTNFTRYLDLPQPFSLSNIFLNFSTFNISEKPGLKPATLHYYAMDASTGTNALENLTGIKNLTVGGNSWVTGILGNAYSANGTEKISTGMNLSRFSNNFTINFWLKRIEATRNSGAIFDSGSELFIRTSPPNQLQVGVSDTGGVEFYSIPLILNKWYMVTVTRNDTGATLWINGTLNQTDINPFNNWNGTAPFCFLSGGPDCDGEPYGDNITIDEVGFWNITLNSTQISEKLYNDAAAISYPQSIINESVDGSVVFSLEVGNVDGVREWTLNDSFNHNQTKNLKDSVLAYEPSCGNTENCTIPFTFFFNLETDYLGVTESTISLLEYSDIDLIYDRKTNNETLLITNYFSFWDYVFGPFRVNFLEFIPKTPTSKNVTPFGQKDDVPILNLTNLGYHLTPMNLSLKINNTESCINVTVSTVNQKANGSLLNESWLNLSHNLNYLSNTSIWLWADYACSNNQNWTLFDPSFFFRQCANATICSEDV